MKPDQIMYVSGWILWIVLVVALCGYVIFGNRKGFRVVATAMATILTVVMILLALDMGGFRMPEIKIWAWSPTDTLNDIIPQRTTVTSTATLPITSTQTPIPPKVTPTMTVAPSNTPVPPTLTPKQTPIVLDGRSVILLNNDGTLVVNESKATKFTFIVTGDDPVLSGWFRTCKADGILYQDHTVICSRGVESIIQLKTDVEYRFEGTQLQLSPLAG